MAVELYYSLRPAEVRRSSRRRAFAAVTARGSALLCGSGALVGAVVGLVLAPLAGALYGLVLGAAAGLLVGVPAALTLALATKSHRGRSRTRVVGAMAAAGWAAVLLAAVGGRSDAGLANGVALGAVLLAIFAVLGAGVAPAAVGLRGEAAPLVLDRFRSTTIAAELVRPIRAFDTTPGV